MKKITWHDYHSDIEKLIKIIEDSGFVPKVILTFPKGGLIPATIISHHFDEADILFDRKDLEIYDSSFDVLVLDDLCDTGNTFLKNYEYFDGKYVKYACLYRKNHSLFKPHFIVTDELDNDEWIVFPYEKTPEDENKAIEEHLKKG